MNIKLEKVNRTKYIIKNSQEQVIYILTKKRFTVGDRYEINDIINNQLAELKENILSDTMYTLFINKKKIKQIKTIKQQPLNNYQ